MRILAATLILLAAACANARAASPEQAYLAARVAYIKVFEHSGETDADFDRQKRAMADLETQLRKIIGPTRLEGFPAEGKIHLGMLYPDDEAFGDAEASRRVSTIRAEG